MKNVSLPPTLVLIVVAGLACFPPAAVWGGVRVKVTPREIDDLLPNPGMGWQTFHRFADEDPNLAGLPSTSAYFRLYWRDIEPTEGEIDFGRFDELLRRAHHAGQKLALRIMCAGTTNDYLYVPRWLKDKGCPGFEYQYNGEGPRHWVPDMNSRQFQEAHFRLIAELGKRYDGHPDLDLIDIGTVGLWGEWHMSGAGVDMPSKETRRAIIDCYLHAFPKTPKVMLIGDEGGLRYAVQHGCGWRADCLGDMGGFSKTWNHMEYFYKQQLHKAGVEEAWKTAPVAFESCWDMRKWKHEGWDIRFIFDYALGLHCSYLNNKSAPIPEGTRPEIERFLRKLGYRFVVRELSHEFVVSPGGDLKLVMRWENVGVAPPYHEYRLAIRLTGPSPHPVVTIAPGVSLKDWLPGKPIEVAPVVRIPPQAQPGEYEVAVAIVDPASHEPVVRLAIAGRAADGWYPVSHVRVGKK